MAVCRSVLIIAGSTIPLMSVGISSVGHICDLMRLFAVLLAVLAVSALSEGVPCDGSGFCSIGMLKPFSGDIYDGALR